MKKSFDFKKHTLPAVSKWFLVRICIYLIILTLLAVAIYTIQQRKLDPSNIETIDQIEIEL